MKKIFAILFAFGLISLLPACSSDNSPRTGAIPEKLEITFSTEPIAAQASSQTILVSKITQNGKAVKNAKVKFEVWATGQENHDMIEAVQTESGKYTINKKFDLAGEYNVIVHVYTPEIHQMIRRNFKVVSSS